MTTLENIHWDKFHQVGAKAKAVEEEAKGVEEEDNGKFKQVFNNLEWMNNVLGVIDCDCIESTIWCWNVNYADV